MEGNATGWLHPYLLRENQLLSGRSLRVEVLVDDGVRVSRLRNDVEE